MSEPSSPTSKRLFAQDLTIEQKALERVCPNNDNSLQDIPPEVLSNIFELLPIQDLGKAVCVCREWKALATDEVLWKRVWKRSYPYCRSQEITSYRKLCIDRFILSRNIAAGTYVQTILEESPPKTIVQFGYSEGKVVTWFPHYWTVWDAKTGERLFPTDSSNVHCAFLAYGANKLFLQTRENRNAIDVVDMRTGKLSDTFFSPPGEIDKAEFIDGKLITASTGNDVEEEALEGGWTSFAIWDVGTGQQIASQSWEFDIEGEFFHNFEIDDGKLITYLCNHRKDDSVRVDIWDLSSGKRINSFNIKLADASAIRWFYSSCFGDKFFFFNPDNNTIDIWNIDTSLPILTIPNVERKREFGISNIQFMKCIGSKLIIGGLDNEIKIFDAGTGQLVQTLNGNKSSYLLYHVDENHIIVEAGDDDITIQIWDLNAGKLLSQISIPDGFDRDIFSTPYSDGKIFFLNATHDSIQILDFNRQEKALK